MEKLVSALKVTTQNLQVLHRNIYGKDFFKAHELTEEYYRTLGDMTDDVIETFMSLGFIEPSIEKACKSFDSIPGGKITVPAAFLLIKEMFLELMTLIDNAKETLPHDITDMLEEYKIFLRVETNYKINRFLGSID